MYFQSQSEFEVGSTVELEKSASTSKGTIIGGSVISKIHVAGPNKVRSPTYTEPFESQHNFCLIENRCHILLYKSCDNYCKSVSCEHGVTVVIPVVLQSLIHIVCYSCTIYLEN